MVEKYERLNITDKIAIFSIALLLKSYYIFYKNTKIQYKD